MEDVGLRASGVAPATPWSRFAVAESRARALEHAERVTLGGGRPAGRGRSERCLSDVRWYRAPAVRLAARRAPPHAASRPPAAEPPGPRPMHLAVQAYRRAMDLPRE